MIENTVRFEENEVQKAVEDKLLNDRRAYGWELARQHELNEELAAVFATLNAMMRRSFHDKQLELGNEAMRGLWYIFKRYQSLVKLANKGEFLQPDIPEAVFKNPYRTEE